MTTTSTSITGGCLCGAIRYESTAPPQMAGACHCRMCQRWTGAVAVMTVALDTETFRFTRGEPRVYMASPLLERHFCADCGSSLMHRYAVAPYGPNVARVGIGTLDDQSMVTAPNFHFGIESHVDGWLEVREGAVVINADEDPGLGDACEALGIEWTGLRLAGNPPTAEP